MICIICNIIIFLEVSMVIGFFILFDQNASNLHSKNVKIELPLLDYVP